VEYVWSMEHGISMVLYGYYILSLTTHHLVHTWFTTMLHAQFCATNNNIDNYFLYVWIPIRIIDNPLGCLHGPNFKIVHIAKYSFLGSFRFDLIMDVFIMVCIRPLYMFVFVFSICFWVCVGMQCCLCHGNLWRLPFPLWFLKVLHGSFYPSPISWIFGSMALQGL